MIPRGAARAHTRLARTRELMQRMQQEMATREVSM